jgi:hypothetical protein
VLGNGNIKKEQIMSKLLVAFTPLLIFNMLSLGVLCGEEHEKVIVINEKVGEVIDKEERRRYKLFPQIENFTSAVFLKLQDGSYAAEVTYEEEGEEKKRRIPQSESAIISLSNHIEEVSQGRTQFFSLANESKIEGKLVSISEKVGASLDAEERSEYKLFKNIPNFERATFYREEEAGFFVAIQTQNDTLISVVLDTSLVSILNDYIERYNEVQVNPEPFEKKWSIISYDEQGMPITENEIFRYYRGSSCWALGGALGGAAVGFVIASLAQELALMDRTDKRSPFPLGIGIILGGGAGYNIGAKYGKYRTDIEGAVINIRISRTPK